MDFGWLMPESSRPQHSIWKSTGLLQAKAAKLYATCAAIAKLMGFADIETAISRMSRGLRSSAVSSFADERGHWNAIAHGGGEVKPLCQ